MNLSELFIRRPVMTTLVMIGILAFGIVAYRELPVSALPNVDFPTIQVTAALPGASPETMASAVATPLEKQFSTIAGIDSMTSTSAPGLDPDHAAVRARPRHRRRRAGRAGGDFARARASCRRRCRRRRRSARSTRRIRRSSILALTSTTLPLSTRQRVRRDAASRSASRRSAAWRRCRCSASRSTPCACSSTRARWPRAASASTRCSRRSTSTTSTCPPARSTASTAAYAVQATGQLNDAAAFRPLIVTYRNGAPVRLGDLGTRHRQRADRQGRRLVQRTSAASCSRSSASPAPTPSRWSTRSRSCCRPSAPQMPPGIEHRRPLRPLAVTIRESVHDVQFTLLLALALVVMVIFLFLRNISGDRHPEPGAADVDHRHLRGDVPARLQPRQPVADGADAVRRLRGGRRDRDAGEHQRATWRWARARCRRRSTARRRSRSPSCR